jgi:hypothetical protein
VLDTGHLLFARSNALWAVPFDRERLDVVGTPRPVVEGVRVDQRGAVHYAVAGDGSLAYLADGRGGDQILACVDRGAGRNWSTCRRVTMSGSACRRTAAVPR